MIRARRSPSPCPFVPVPAVVLALLAFVPPRIAPAAPSSGFVEGTGSPEVEATLAAQRAALPGLPPAARPEVLRADVGDVVILEDDGTLMFNGVMVLDRMIQEFTASHADSFDLVAIFGATTYPTELEVVEGGGVTAYSYAVRNEVLGTGISLLDRNAELGIDTERLRNVIVANDLRKYGAAPGDTVPGSTVGFTGTEIVAHEAGHMALAFVGVDSVVTGAIISDFGHWSARLDGRASLLGGARWQDNLDGTFTVIQNADSFSQLDQYLLGLRAADDVDPMFWIDTTDIPLLGVPAIGTTVNGTRIDFTIDDVIAQNGPRVPDAASAPHDFRMAIVLLIPYDTEPGASDLAYLEALGDSLETWFAAQTDGLGTLDTTLPPRPVTADFTSDVFAGTAPLTVGFHDHSSGTITERTWDFGDGSPVSSEMHPEHTYTANGHYTVTLTVDGAGGPAQRVRTALIHVDDYATVFADDFETDQGWTVGEPNDAIRGNWERGDPEGTVKDGVPIQPEDDHTPAGTMAWVTGLAAGGGPSAFDVDGGSTTLYSPILDLSGTVAPLVSYVRWFTNNAGQRPAEHPFVAQVSNDSGATWVDLESVNVSGPVYRRAQFLVSDFVSPTATMRFRFLAEDPGLASLVEAAFDDFEILDGMPTAVPDVAPGSAALAMDAPRPNPFADGAAVTFRLPAPGHARLAVYDAAGRLVCELARGPLPAGTHRVAWDGRDARGDRVASGVYLYRLEAAGETITGKAVRVR